MKLRWVGVGGGGGISLKKNMNAPLTGFQSNGVKR